MENNYFIKNLMKKILPLILILIFSFNNLYSQNTEGEENPETTIKELNKTIKKQDKKIKKLEEAASAKDKDIEDKKLKTEQLKQEHATKLAKLKQDHTTELVKLEQDHTTKVATLNATIDANEYKQKFDGKVNELNKAEESKQETEKLLNSATKKTEKLEKDLQSINDRLAESKEELEAKVEELTKSEAGALGSNEYFWFLVFLIILLLTTSIIAGLSSLYLYKWRVSLSNKDLKEILLPEDFNKLMTEFQESIKNTDGSISKNTIKFRELERSSLDKMEEISNTVIDFKRSINKKDKEIERFKEGYDLKVYKKFLSRFIAIKEALHEYIENGKHNEDILKIFKNLENRFLDAFDACELEEFKVEVGKSYKDYPTDDLSIEWTKEDPLNAKTGGTIKEVRGVGYRSEKPDGTYIIIKPVKVIVHKVITEKPNPPVTEETNKKSNEEKEEGDNNG